MFDLIKFLLLNRKILRAFLDLDFILSLISWIF